MGYFLHEMKNYVKLINRYWDFTVPKFGSPEQKVPWINLDTWFEDKLKVLTGEGGFEKLIESGFSNPLVLEEKQISHFFLKLYQIWHHEFYDD